MVGSPRGQSVINTALACGEFSPWISILDIQMLIFYWAWGGVMEPIRTKHNSRPQDSPTWTQFIFQAQFLSTQTFSRSRKQLKWLSWVKKEFNLTDPLSAIFASNRISHTSFKLVFKWKTWQQWMFFVCFLLLVQSVRLHLRTCVSPHTPTDGGARIFFLNSYAATGNRTHISSVAPLWGSLIQGALLTEQPRPR